MVEMTVFRVSVRCDRIVMSVNGRRGAYGFYRNEYVRAPDSATAAKVAEANVRAALQRDRTVADISTQTAVFEIDEVEDGFDESDLLAEDGFVFFKSEGPG